MNTRKTALNNPMRAAEQRSRAQAVSRWAEELDLVFAALREYFHLSRKAGRRLLAWQLLALVAGCGRPDGRALQALACQQVANSIDLQSVAQLDALRKALGVAPQ